MGWEGSRQEWSSTLTPSPSHPIPARLSPFLAAHSPQSPALHTPDIPLSRGWCSVFPSGMGAGGEADPATWPEVLSCLPVCPQEGRQGGEWPPPRVTPYLPLTTHQRAPQGGQGQTNPAAERLVWLLPSLLCPPPVTWGQADGL